MVIVQRLRRVDYHAGQPQLFAAHPTSDRVGECGFAAVALGVWQLRAGCDAPS